MYEGVWLRIYWFLSIFYTFLITNWNGVEFIVQCAEDQILMCPDTKFINCIT